MQHLVKSKNSSFQRINKKFIIFIAKLMLVKNPEKSKKYAVSFQKKLQQILVSKAAELQEVNSDCQSGGRAKCQVHFVFTVQLGLRNRTTI